MPYMMTVTLLTGAAWATPEELQLRLDLEAAIEVAIDGNGFVDGGDSGMGAMTIFVVDVADPHKARARVEKLLIAQQLIGKAEITVFDDESDDAGPART